MQAPAHTGAYARPWPCHTVSQSRRCRAFDAVLLLTNFSRAPVSRGDDSIHYYSLLVCINCYYDTSDRRSVIDDREGGPHTHCHSTRIVISLSKKKRCFKIKHEGRAGSCSFRCCPLLYLASGPALSVKQPAAVILSSWYPVRPITSLHTRIVLFNPRSSARSDPRLSTIYNLQQLALLARGAIDSPVASVLGASQLLEAKLPRRWRGCPPV